MDAPRPSQDDPPPRESRGEAGSRGEARDVGASRLPPPSAFEPEAFVDALEGKDPESRRFSVWELLGVVTAASLVLSLGSYLPKDVFAGTVGVGTLLSMVGLSAMKNPPAVLQVGWWVLLLIYLMAIASAVWG